MSSCHHWVLATGYFVSPAKLKLSLLIMISWIVVGICWCTWTSCGGNECALVVLSITGVSDCHMGAWLCLSVLRISLWFPTHFVNVYSLCLVLVTCTGMQTPHVVLSLFWVSSVDVSCEHLLLLLSTFWYTYKFSDFPEWWQYSHFYSTPGIVRCTMSIHRAPDGRMQPVVFLRNSHGPLILM